MYQMSNSRSSRRTLNLPTSPGVYVLVLEVPQDVKLCTKSGKTFSICRGLYLYVGSAMRGLRARILRYLEKSTRKHWHIDYLLDYALLRMIVYSVVTQNYSVRPECALSREIARSCNVTPVPGFGCTDIRKFGVVSNLYRSNVGLKVVSDVMDVMRRLFNNVHILTIY